MARKKTSKGKGAKKTAPKRATRAKSAKRVTKSAKRVTKAAKKPPRASAKKATPTATAISKVADALGAADLLRAWSSTRYSR